MYTNKKTYFMYTNKKNLLKCTVHPLNLASFDFFP